MIETNFFTIRLFEPQSEIKREIIIFGMREIFETSKHGEDEISLNGHENPNKMALNKASFETCRRFTPRNYLRGAISTLSVFNQDTHPTHRTQTQQKPNIEFEHIVRFDDARIFTP